MKGILLLNGCVPNCDIEVCDDDVIVCADGAFDWAISKGIKPSIVVGDMDSVNGDYSQFTNVCYSSIKDMTDGEIGVDFLLEKKVESIEIWGAFGKRVDHFLGNLQLLIRCLNRNTFALCKDEATTLFCANSIINIELPLNTTLSLVPFSSEVHIIKSQGLKYGFDSLTLKLGETVGLSNCTIANKISFEVVEGIVLVIINNT